MAYLFVWTLGLTVIVVLVMFVIDISQTTHAVRRNFPVIGRFRYFFEHLGEFFRPYFFAMDREEMPFNRAERAWVYRAAKGDDQTVAFGSTRDLRVPGTVLFLNSPVPVLDGDAGDLPEVVIGPQTRQPYATRHFFHVSGMSFGAISKPAVQALSAGARRAGVWMNTGEGGLSPYHLEGGADIVFQIGTAKYGVRDAQGYLSDERLRAIAEHAQVRMFELKLSQGAKPGKGGILPGVKVTEEIARIRFIAPGQDSLSPNRHPEIQSVDDLLDVIGHIREVTGKPTGFKAVIGAHDWLDELCEAIRRRGREHAPDFITVDSGDGGTGAAPLSLIDSVGLPLKEGLPLVVDALIRHGLRDRVKVIASGKMITPTPVAWALCMGADFVVSARGFMFALGCIQSLQCNKNTCPTGITTHDQRLQRGLVLPDKTERVHRYAEAMHHEVSIIAHSCGLPSPRGFGRRHVRIVQANGLSVPLVQLHPEPTTLHGVRSEQASG
ncbi:MAG: FMN-binding glutamate synthase family protein [Pseudomonadales bacterium]|nr:FMN-binding glutamate synthase family protein [Pseudomonadales bacterium]MCP5183618.1 FMN-binding glutamate synthase family protein [Pseudomonadales bacterium]